MAFLKDSDYDVQIRSEINNLIDDTEQKTKLRKAEGMAIGQMKNYLGGRYDLEQIFIDAPDGEETDQRDQFVVMTCIDLTLYHLWSKEGGNNIPQTRTDRYADALEWLKSVQKGAATNLPILTDEDGNTKTRARIWSKHEPSNNRF